jgi:hypothetical protein
VRLLVPRRSSGNRGLRLAEYWRHCLKVYNEERRLLASSAARDRAKLERRAGEIKRESERLVDAITQGAPADVIAPKLKASQAEGQSVQEQLSAADDKGKPVAIHPAAINNYLKDIAAMRKAVDGGEAAERPELIAPLRGLIHSIVVHAQPGVRGSLEVEIAGASRRSVLATFCGWVPLVAGGGATSLDPLFQKSCFRISRSITGTTVLLYSTKGRLLCAIQLRFISY